MNAQRLFMLTPLIVFFSGMVNAAICVPQIDVLRHEALISVAPNKELNSLYDALQCAALVAKQRKAIHKISVVFAQGIYRQVSAVIMPKELALWGGELELTSNGHAVFTGASKLDRGQKIKDGYTHLPLSKLVSKDLEKFWIRDHGYKPLVAPPELIVDGQIFHIAREPDNGFFHVNRVESDENSKFSVLESIPETRVKPYIQGYLNAEWADSIRQVASVNQKTKMLTLSGPPPKYGIKSGGRFILMNAPSYVDEIGEYALDTDGSLLVKAEPSTKDFEITTAESILVANKISNLKISNLTFYGVRGSALILNGNNILLDKITVTKSGWVGVVLSGNKNILRNSMITDTGFSAVMMRGGDRKTLLASQSKIEGNIVSRFGRLAWSSVPGVRVDGVGITVENNQISDGPHAGIFYFGNNHLIKNNEVFNVAKMTGDVGAIYSGRDWAGRGNQVIGNYVHDVAGVGVHKATAIYLDDQVSGITVKNNIIWNVYRGILLGGGRDNIIQNNIIVKSEVCLRLDDRGTNWQLKAVADNGVLVKNLQKVPYNKPPYSIQYPELASVLTDRRGYPVNNVVTNNIGFCKWDIDKSAIEIGKSVVADNFTSGDPGFKNIRLLMGGNTPKREDFYINGRVWFK